MSPNNFCLKPTSLVIPVCLGIFLILSNGCTKKIRPARSVFIKQGKGPTVDLSQYRSPQLRVGQDSSLAVAVAISGGGARAYNFAMGVLLGLEEIQTPEGNFLQEIDYISTVSGGSFAAGAFIRARHDYVASDPSEPFSLARAYSPTIEQELSRSYLKPVLQSWVNPRTWFTHMDDGDGLEKAIDHYLMGYRERRDSLGKDHVRSLVLRDVFIPKDSLHIPVLHPMFLTNSTILSNMVIFPFAPNVLDTFLIKGYTHNMREVKYGSGMDPYSLPLSVGIKASGSFPVAISNTTLISNYDPKYRFLHLIDGGVADNIGYHSALEMLEQDTFARKKILLIIDADGEGQVRSFTHKEGGALWFSVLARLPSSGIDSRRVFRREMIENLCRQQNVTPIFLSFASLIEEFPFLLPQPEIPYESASKEIIQSLNNDLDSLDIQGLRRLYDLSNGVKTKYSIKDFEQELLTLTGKKVVHIKKQTLIDLLHK